MKMKILRVGRQTLSIILTVMMIISTMLVGTITTVSAATTTKIYVDVGSYWTNANIWAWNDSENFSGGKWPGASMTQVGSSSVYYYELDNEATKVIFNNGDGKQTADLDLANDTNSKDWATTEKIYVLSNATAGSWQNYNNKVTYGVGTGMSSYGSVTATVASGSSVAYKNSVTFTATAKEGYTFAGWYDNAACTGNAVSLDEKYTTAITAETTLYAKFSEPDYIYLKNKNNWTHVNAYFFNDSGDVGNAWPGYEMEAIEGTDFYRVAVPSGGTYYTFNNGGSENSLKQYPANNTNESVSDYIGKVFNNDNNKWFSFDSSQKYSIVGNIPVAGDWNTYTPIETKVDDFGTYSIDVSITNTAESYFRIALTSSTSTQYGPYYGGAANHDIAANTTAQNAYEASAEYNSYAFYFSSTGNYRIYVCDAYVENNIPDVWVTKLSEVDVDANYKVYYGVNDYLMGSLSAKTADGTTVDNNSEVKYGTSVTFTATPVDGYRIEGWYSDEDFTTKISSAGTNSTYSTTINGVTKVYVKYTSSAVAPDTFTLYQYNKGNVTNSTDLDETSGSHLFKDSYTMSYQSLGGYSFYYVEISNDTNEYMFNIKSSDGTYYYQTASPSKYYTSLATINAPVENYSLWKQQFKTNGAGNKPYYIIFTPASGDNTYEICVASTLPDPTPRYTVNMNQGVASTVNSSMGTSYLEGVSGQKTVRNTYDDLIVTFTTETTRVNNTTLDYTGYMYQVYGYSIVMTLNDGTKQVVGIVNPLGDAQGERQITALANGVYQFDYTFPSNIKSAEVTPIFTVSDDYASKKGITFTAVYLKCQPGDNVFGNTYEPQYYTWRSTSESSEYVNGLERQPEGTWDGQSMLHTNDDMYIAYVQSGVLGIVFNNTTTNQTYDFDEFRKLQELGYNNITFEPKDGGGETVASSINTMVKNGTVLNGSKVYSGDGATVTINDTLVNSDFELDVDIEGYYIDVFGNRLTDTSGNEIKQSDLLATLDTVTVVNELNALLEATGQVNKIYGARYGWYTTSDSDYGMEYAIRNYYIDGSNNKIISQQISGYGTIEGAISPIDSTKTNAQYIASLNTTDEDNLHYYLGAKDSYGIGYFKSGYELISAQYAHLPYLVSYKNRYNYRATDVEKDQTDAYRIDGKWYYMAKTPQITVDAKVGLMNADGSLEMTDDGVIADQTGIGTAYVNGVTSSTFDQGSSARLNAVAASGYRFVGFYEADGTFIFDANPHTMTFSSSTSVYAVFQPISSGSLTVTNNIYRFDNPANGGGNGAVTVKLIITPQNDDGSYGTPVEVNGTNTVSYTIDDGDKYQWVITGTPSGIDKFLTFRMAETQNDSTIYYSALDDENCLTNNGTTYTYTSYEGFWNWFAQTGETDETKYYKTIDLFTDFSKTSIYATLHYKYLNRFNESRTYTVQNVLLSEDNGDDLENYTPSEATILKYAPPIDEVFTDCTWTISDSTKTQSGSTVILQANQEKKKFKTYIYTGESPQATAKEAYFNDVVELIAPGTLNGEEFSYWKRYLIDETGAPIGSGDIFSYEMDTQIRVTFHSYYEAVYGEDVSLYTTNLQDAIYTREKYTDENGNTVDYVYADYLIQFETSDSYRTFADCVNESNGDIKFGIVLERDIAADPYAGEETITAPTTNEDLVKETILASAKDLSSGGSASSWNATTDKTLAQYNYYYNIYDLTNITDDLTVFGRYDFYFRFSNTESNRSKVYNVYTYIIYTDDNGDTQIIISNPKVLSIYATGIKSDGSTVVTSN